MMQPALIIALLSVATLLASGQSPVAIDRPRAEYPTISKAFDGKTKVRRTVDSGGLAHYEVRFYDEKVIGDDRGPYLTDAVLSVTTAEGVILVQSWLDVSGVSHVPPDDAKFRMIRFSVSESLERSSVLSIGIFKSLHVYFSPFRLEPPEKTEAEQGGTGQPATRPESKSEGSDKPQPESERRSR